LPAGRGVAILRVPVGEERMHKLPRDRRPACGKASGSLPGGRPLRGKDDAPYHPLTALQQQAGNSAVGTALRFGRIPSRQWLAVQRSIAQLEQAASRSLTDLAPADATRLIAEFWPHPPHWFSSALADVYCICCAR
jgi:hypothetical protein